MSTFFLMMSPEILILTLCDSAHKITVKCNGFGLFGMKKNYRINFFFIVLALSNVINAQQITLNEVMFNPAGADDYDEYIEVINAGETEANLTGLYLVINGIVDSIFSPGGDTLLAPDGFALVMDRGYLIERRSATYDTIIPTGTTLLSIQDNAFGINGLSNTGSSEIFLMNVSGDTLSRVSVLPDQEAGFSEEKIDYLGKDITANWGNSTRLYGTPGLVNSIARKNIDLAILDFSCISDTNKILPGDNIETELRIANPGREPVIDARIYLGIDKNGDLLLRDSEIIFSDRHTFQPLDTLTIYPVISKIKSGRQRIVCLLDAVDENPENNRAQLLLKIPYRKGCLAINEFMFAPKPDYGGEWIELMNISDDTLNLAGWSISDNSSTVTITQDDNLLPPKDFALLSSSESITEHWRIGGLLIHCVKPLPTLNNTEDSIVVRDLCGNIIDSLKYSSSWGYRQGVSLERIDPYKDSDLASNWALSIDSTGGTPGYKNSITINDFDLTVTEIGLVADTGCPKPGQPAELFVVVKNAGRKTVEDAEIYLGIDSNRDSLLQQKEVLYIDVLTIFPGDSVVLYPTILGFESGKNTVIGQLITEDDNMENNTGSFVLRAQFPWGSLAINEFMYIPNTGFGGEWIELFNVSADTVNLSEWQISDNSNTVTITESDWLLAPSAYTLISSDETITDYWNVGGLYIHMDSPLPTLNNAGDSIVVRDLCGHVVDSLKYSSGWGYRQGVSLERIDPYKDSDLASNWALSMDSTGGTPGFKNSRMIKNIDLGIDSVWCVSDSLMDGDPLEIHYIVGNKGLRDVQGYTVYLGLRTQGKKGNYRAVRDTIVYYSDSLSAQSFRRNTVVFKRVSGGVYRLYCELFLLDDEKIENDSDSCIVIVGYPENSLVINEVMNIPEPGESEWFELYNTTPDSLDLNLWRFRDAGGGWQDIVTQRHIISPNGYCIVAARADFRQTYPDFDSDLIVPDKFPILNNGSDSLFIVDGTGHLIDRVVFQQSWGGSTGVSIERKNPSVPALDQYNWGSSTDSGGATPGRQNSILKYQMNLAIIPESFQFFDSTLTRNSQAVFSIDVCNKGRQESNSFSLTIYRSSENEDLPDEEEIIWTADNIFPMLPDSICSITGEFPANRSGRNHYRAIIEMSGDEYIGDNAASADLLVGYPDASVTLNEFLAYPAGDQVEFIEVINCSDEQVCFDEWWLGDNRSRVKLSATGKTAPGAYVVIAPDSSFFDSFPTVLDWVIIPDKWPVLGNTFDNIILKDITGQTIDSLFYDETWNMKPGVSFEKILPEYPGGDPSSWTLCRSNTGATPGCENSVTPKLYDLCLDSAAIIQESDSPDSLIRIICWISNSGRRECPAAEIVLTENNKTVSTYKIDVLPAGERDSVEMIIDPPRSGVHWLLLSINWDMDMSAENDTFLVTVRIPFPRFSLLISEFMAKPDDLIEDNTKETEYVEIYSPLYDIPLEEWKLSDANISQAAELLSGQTIGRGQYFVLAADSSIFNYSGCNSQNTIVLDNFPNLNNDADAIVIRDPAGRTIDSLYYDEGWKIAQGISTEKVCLENPNSAENWRLSTDPSGGTPGYRNSVCIDIIAKKHGIHGEPNPFSPNGDGIDDSIALVYQLPYPSARVTVQIYDLMGRLIYEPAKDLLSSAEGVVYWDGSSTTGNRARVGMYVVRCSATDLASDKTVGYVTTIVLAR